MKGNAIKYLDEAWRWFGPKDIVSLADIRQAGAKGIVSALHYIPNGEVWPVEEILKRKSEIENAGLRWSVVESVPVHEDIKKMKVGFQTYIENYKQTLMNLASCGLFTVCYNFMPVLDWTRTSLAYIMPDGSKALRFDRTQFIAFDVFILKRNGAAEIHGEEAVKKARVFFENASQSELKEIQDNILAGLPGAEENYTLEQFREKLEEYTDIGDDTLRKNLEEFIRAVAPVAASNNVQLAIHPDDPPYSIFGLPRVVSTLEDMLSIIGAYDSPANGLCFCTGSLGVRADNDLPAMVRTLSHRINFVHLRSTSREPDGSFYEANHLEGDVDMPSIMEAILIENNNRNKPISFRPDHGHQMLDDLSKKVNPGYSAIGRLRGLAELRGLQMGIGRKLKM